MQTFTVGQTYKREVSTITITRMMPKTVEYTETFHATGETFEKKRMHVNAFDQIVKPSELVTAEPTPAPVTLKKGDRVTYTDRDANTFAGTVWDVGTTEAIIHNDGEPGYDNFVPLSWLTKTADLEPAPRTKRSHRKTRNTTTIIVYADGRARYVSPSGEVLETTADTPSKARRILRATLRRYRKTGML
jgi:hypothetical protein